jgi:hypothetical protein
VLEKVKAAIAADGAAQFETVVVDEGVEGFQAFTRAAVSPVFCLQRGHLFGATDVDLLRTVLRGWGKEGSRTLAGDSPVFARVQRGLNGGAGDTVCLLGYADLQAVATYVWPFLALAQGELPAGWLDWSKVPNLADVRGHLSGVAVGLRHDRDGVTLDVFSPAGVLVPSVVVALATIPAVDVQVAPAEPHVRPREASLGLRARSSVGEGVNVLSMHERGAAARAGLERDDTIIGFDGKRVATIEDLDTLVASAEAGRAVKLTVRRGEDTLEIVVTLGARDD